MDFNRYASSAADLNITDNSESGFYHLVISAGTNTFILFATASGAQGSDSDCIIFSINQMAPEAPLDSAIPPTTPAGTSR